MREGWRGRKGARGRVEEGEGRLAREGVEGGQEKGMWEGG